MSWDRFVAAVRDELPNWGGQRLRGPILRAVWTSAHGAKGVVWERPAAAERARAVLRDWHRALQELEEASNRMVSVLDALGLTRLVTTITGLSAVGAACILSETGDPARYDSARTWVKHAGLCPRANESGTYNGQTRISRRGRPALRTAAWRAVWGAVHTNPVYRDRYHYLRTRPNNPLKDGQARVAVAAALLRQLFIVVSQQVAWDPAIARGDLRPNQEMTPQAA